MAFHWFQRFASTNAKLTYFASVIYDKCVQHNLELVHKESQNDGAHNLFIKSADKSSKKKVYPCMEKWNHSVNFLFRKSLNRSEHCMRHHFLKMNCSRRCHKPSSRLLQDSVMRQSWNWGWCHFLSFVFSVNARFVFSFIVFYIWINSDRH